MKTKPETPQQKIARLAASVPFKNVDLIERNLAEARKGI